MHVKEAGYIRQIPWGRRGRRILLFLQRTRELVYVPRTRTVGIYLEEIGGGCCGSPLQFYNSS
jgi:hypothetical protein